MRTTLSFGVSPVELKKTRTLARVRGFSTTSDYLRFLLEQDDVHLINEDELFKRSKDVDRLYKSKKLIQAKSLADLIN